MKFKQRRLLALLLLCGVTQTTATAVETSHNDTFWHPMMKYSLAAGSGALLHHITHDNILAREKAKYDALERKYNDSEKRVQEKMTRQRQSCHKAEKCWDEKSKQISARWQKKYTDAEKQLVATKISLDAATHASDYNKEKAVYYSNELKSLTKDYILLKNRYNDLVSKMNLHAREAEIEKSNLAAEVKRTCQKEAVIKDLTIENTNFRAQIANVAVSTQKSACMLRELHHSNCRRQSLINYWQKTTQELEQERDTMWVNQIVGTNRNLMFTNTRLTQALHETEMMNNSLRRQNYLLKRLQNTNSNDPVRAIEWQRLSYL